jgi:hypothetical protein
LTPIDEYDQACFIHDVDYRYCREQFSREIGRDVPSYVSPVVSFRFLIHRKWFGFSPQPIREPLLDYLKCLDKADRELSVAAEELMTKNPGDTSCSIAFPFTNSCILQRRTTFRAIADFMKLNVGK